MSGVLDAAVAEALLRRGADPRDVRPVDAEGALTDGKEEHPHAMLLRTRHRGLVYRLFVAAAPREYTIALGTISLQSPSTGWASLAVSGAVKTTATARDACAWLLTKPTVDCDRGA